MTATFSPPLEPPSSPLLGVGIRVDGMAYESRCPQHGTFVRKRQDVGLGDCVLYTYGCGCAVVQERDSSGLEMGATYCRDHRAAEQMARDRVAENQLQCR